MSSRSSRFVIVLAAAIFIAGAPLARAATCFDRAQITDYDPALIRAIQAKLRDRGIYSGPIDGNPGPSTRAALARLTKRPATDEFRLWTGLVQEIFGPNYGGIYYPEDQDKIIQQLGLTPDPHYRNPCRVHVSPE